MGGVRPCHQSHFVLGEWKVWLVQRRLEKVNKVRLAGAVFAGKDVAQSLGRVRASNPGRAAGLPSAELPAPCQATAWSWARLPRRPRDWRPASTFLPSSRRQCRPLPTPRPPRSLRGPLPPWRHVTAAHPTGLGEDRAAPRWLRGARGPRACTSPSAAAGRTPRVTSHGCGRGCEASDLPSETQ